MAPFFWADFGDAYLGDADFGDADLGDGLCRAACEDVTTFVQWIASMPLDPMPAHLMSRDSLV
jgi:hypothetical protein